MTEIFVYGNSLSYYLVAIVVPDETYATNWAKTNPTLAKLSFPGLFYIEIKKINDFLKNFANLRN